MLLAACGSDDSWTARPHDPSLIDQRPDASSVHDAFQPVEIRIHPLSRWIDPSGQTPLPAASAEAGSRAELEVRVEAVDRDGIETRSLGLLWIELECTGAQWTVGPVNLSDPLVNRSTFELITRTYRLSVVLPPSARPGPGSEVVITAFLRLPNGELLEARRGLAWR